MYSHTVFLFNYTATTRIYRYRHALSLPDALPSSRRKGGTLRSGPALPGDGPGKPTVTVDGEPLSAGAYVFACGPWLPKVFPHLLCDRSRVPRREIFYVGSPSDDHRYRWEHLPNIADPDTYTASDVDYGIKVAARLRDLPMDPDDGDRKIGRASCRERVCQYV